MSAYRVAVDVGGTFTDVIIHEEKTGRIGIAKVPSTLENPAIGVMESLKKAEVNPADVIFFSHGSTVGTNALITRKLPKCGFVATKGFRDIVEIRRGDKGDIWDPYQDVPKPYIPRRYRLEVDERVDYSGKILEPLNDDEARSVARRFRRLGIESIAVSFINAYMNDANERRMKAIIKEEYPEAFVFISSEIVPVVQEHERTSTTQINAVLSSVVSRYLHDLTSRLRAGRYKGDVLVQHSGGGVMTAETIAYYAARIANSGPAAGAVAASYIAKICGFQNSIGLDMGGTSTDVSLMHQGELRRVNEWWIEYGYPILFPSIEIVSIGAGGGSVAWIDEGGSLRNGPMSVGADPGPTCYMRGGEEPTNTDANLILNRLAPEMFLGGDMKISRDFAEKVIKDKIGDKLGLDTLDAADAILKIANANMCDAVRLISIKRGFDPREFALLAFGGAGPMHAAYVAKELSIPTVIIPPWPGITSALGCLLVDVRHDLTKTYIAKASDTNIGDLEREFTKLEEKAVERLKTEGIPEDKMQMTRYVEMMYLGQWRTLSVPFPRPIGESLEPLYDKFHQEYEREYAYSRKEQSVEVHGLSVVAIGIVKKLELPRYEIKGKAEDALKGRRKVYFDDEGFIDAEIYTRSKLPAGSKFEGPSIIEQMDSTITVPPGFRVEVDEYLNVTMSCT